MTHEHAIQVFINKKKFELPDAVQTGAALKELAGISLNDVLFLQRPGEDEVIANDGKVTLKNGDHLHSQPPADYGRGAEAPFMSELDRYGVVIHPQADGWSFLVIPDYSLPEGFQPGKVRLLIKLPPTFPDGSPDMFWVHPAVRSPSGSLPRGTSIERLLNEDWQRFSWHLAAGAWKPGESTLRDYLRCVRGRFFRMD